MPQQASATSIGITRLCGPATRGETKRRSATPLLAEAVCRVSFCRIVLLLECDTLLLFAFLFLAFGITTSTSWRRFTGNGFALPGHVFLLACSWWPWNEWPKVGVPGCSRSSRPWPTFFCTTCSTPFCWNGPATAIFGSTCVVACGLTVKGTW